jgi:hypothetical protein
MHKRLAELRDSLQARVNAEKAIHDSDVACAHYVAAAMSRCRLETAQACNRELLGALMDMEADADETPPAPREFCAWGWNAGESRWIASCGYGFKPATGIGNAGDFLPFPFCPYCGKRIENKTGAHEADCAVAVNGRHDCNRQKGGA